MRKSAGEVADELATKVFPYLGYCILINVMELAHKETLTLWPGPVRCLLVKMLCGDAEPVTTDFVLS